MQKHVLIWLALLFFTACAVAPESAPADTTATPPPTEVNPTPTQTAMPDVEFDGDNAFAYLTAQTDLGPRPPGSDGHSAVRDLITDELAALGWEVERQTFDYQGFEAMNLIGRTNTDMDLPVVMLAAHYDTRARADQSPGFEDTPVIGAVDGASGVAVLLELARTLNTPGIDKEIWLTFFDVEDNGSDGIDGWDWINGSRYMAANLTTPIESMVLVDMIGDADQQLYYEGNSDPALSVALWDIAHELGFADQFIPELKYTMIDDHVPFRQLGISAVDIIDFDYPYWHTVEDTPDKASADSLFRVGRTIEVWLENHQGTFNAYP
ncbi:MAG: M28 family peptidase [Anaerolineae bacterium]|nr:M28 family peptidase [Anaerolineae bacterium]